MPRTADGPTSIRRPRIGAAAVLTLVLVVLRVLDVAVPGYHVSPGILLPLPGAILALLELEASTVWRGVRPIHWVGSPKFTAGDPAPLIALVHHRMVGTLRSTDAADGLLERGTCG